MSLASLTVDLTLGLAKFESDSGKAAQIIKRDQGDMSRAALSFVRALERQSEQANKTNAQLQILKGASLGVGDDILAKVSASGSAFAPVGAQGVAAFKAIGTAAAGAVADTDKLLSLAVSKIREVNQQAAALKAKAIAQNEGTNPSLSDDGLKVRLQRINLVREETLKQINVEFTREKQAQQAAAAEIAAGEARRAAAQKVIDAQNGLTATYRQQLAVLRELRDAGALTQAQFKQAGSDLVAKQPVSQQRASDAAAALRESRNATQAEATASARAASAAIAANANATASAQAQIYTGFLLAQAAAAQKVAEAEARQAEISKQVGAAVDRARTAQEAAYATKVAYIGKVNEEAAALFRTRDAQRQLDAERAGVSSKEAAQLSKVTGDRELLANIYQRIEAEEQLAAAFGKSTAEILRQQAAERGISNTAAKPIARFAALEESNKAAAATAAATKANNAFIESVNRQANAIGKLPSQLLAEESARRGVTAQTAAAVAKMADLEKATGQAGKSAFASRNQLLTLQYTLGDIAASAASGISPLTILLQQGGQVFDAFSGDKGGIGNVFKGLLSFVTPFRLALVGASAAAGAFAFAMFEGARQSKAFNDAVVLSGNFAGITEGKFNSLAKSISANGQVSISAAREFTQALVATGQVGPQVLGQAAEAAARFGAATGKSAKDVAAEFATLNGDVTAGAKRLNESLNFLTTAQLDQIRALQDQGRAADAQGIVYEALNTRLKALEPNLGTLDRILRGVGNTWRSFWDSAFDIGRTQTIDDKISALREKIARGGAPAAPVENSGGAGFVGQSSGRRKATQDARDTQDAIKLDNLLREKQQQTQAAFLSSQAAVTTKDGLAAKEYVDGYLKRGKALDAYVKEVAKANVEFEKLARAGSPVSAANQALILKKIKEDFTDKDANNDAASARKALLDQDLKFVKDNFTQQQEAAQFGQQALQATYASGVVSLKQFYDAKRAIITAGVDAELNALIDEQARLEVELDQGGFKNDAEKIRVQTLLNESLDKSAKVKREASRAGVLANLEETASFKALNDRVTEFRANLLQLQGDEIGAARARAALQEQASRVVAVQSGGAISEEDLARQSRAIALANEFSEVQRRAGQVSADLARSEESFLLRSTQNGATLREQEQGVYAIRATSLVQLGELAEKARQFALVSTDPRVLQYAEELTLAYQKAADTVDPAINRLRSATEGLGQSLSTDIVSIVGSSKQIGAQRYAEARKDVAEQRKLYDDQLKDLRKSLAQSSDAKEQALLRDLIKKKEAQKKSAEVDKLDVFFKSLERDIFGPILKKIQEAALKLLITDPLEKNLTSALREVTEGGGEFATLLKDLLGAGKGITVDKGGAGIDAGGAGFSQAKDSAAAYETAASSVATLTTNQTSLASATTTQTQTVTASTSALAEMAISARAAASGLNQVASSGGIDLSKFGGGGGGSTPYDSIPSGVELATGTNRIPYDGFKATLHKDEAVVPAAFNPYAPNGMAAAQRPTKQESSGGGRGWGGGEMNVIVNAPPGTQVDRQERRNTPQGQELEVFLSLAEKRFAAGIASGSGPGADALKARGVNLSGAIPRRA